MKKVLFFICLVGIVLAGTYLLGMNNAKWTKQSVAPTSFPTLTPKPSPSALPNPASVYCTQVGGTLTIQKNSTGAEYGLCTFLDNRSCEEWALYRGDCPVGGVKTTGYVTDAERFCAWVGGQTTTTSPTCMFKDGSVCANDALFQGTCQKGMQKQ